MGHPLRGWAPLGHAGVLELVEAGRRTLVHVEIDAEALDGGVREIEAAHACDCAAADTNLAGELTHRQALRPQESVEREAGAAHPHLFHNVTRASVLTLAQC